MSLAQEVSDAVVNAVAESLAPISENTTTRIVDGVRGVVRDELIAKLSGKEFTVTIKIPDLTK